MLYPTLAFLALLVAFYLLLGGALLIDALRRSWRARMRGATKVSESASRKTAASTVSVGTARRAWRTDVV